MLSLPLINRHIHYHCSLHHTKDSLNPDWWILTRHNKVGISSFAMLLRRCRIRYRDPSHQLSCLSLAPPISANVYPQNPPSIPCPHEERSHHRRTSRTPTQHPLSSCHHCKPISPHIQIENSCGREERRTYPSSKCLHRFNANCAFVLQDVHSSLNTTFFVVLAFLWNTGFVWPP